MIAALALTGLLFACSGSIVVGFGDGTTPPPVTPTVTVQPGAENLVFDTPARTNLGFQFGPPDGTLGAVRNADNTYTFFVSARSNSTCGGTPLTQGTYRLAGSLTAIGASGPCRALMTASGDPNGYTFDRDYAGGGPVLPISNGAGQTALLLVYHGEWQGGTCAKTNKCFYGSLGMAVSFDGGATFAKLGEIVQPTIARMDSINAGKNLDVGGGTMIIADGNGRFLPNPALADPADVYLYIFYSDKDPAASTTAPCAANACLAVTRARLADVAQAAFARNTAAFPQLFHKFYLGSFTEPATSGDANAAQPSGHYTPIVADAGNYPTVVYDTSVGLYLLAYTVNNNAIVMRSGDTLLDWSAPIASGAISAPGMSFVYTTLIGDSGDTTTSNGSPWLYYVRAPMWPDWPDAVVVARQLHLSVQ